MEADRPPSNVSLNAEELVTTVLERAQQAVMNDTNTDQRTEPTDGPRRHVDWASCRDFNVDLGLRQISQYVGTWDVDPRWLLHVAHLETTEEDYNTVHRYRARWSIPTRRCPVPRETASVYFSVRVSKVRPRNDPVEVRYVVEASRSEVRVAAAGGREETRFRERWLEDLAGSKALLRQRVDF
ncbi:unnamed protein product [Merluccius merluccius]